MIDLFFHSRDFRIVAEKEIKGNVVLSKIKFCSGDMTYEQAKKLCDSLLIMGLDCKVTREEDRVCVVGEKMTIVR